MTAIVPRCRLTLLFEIRNGKTQLLSFLLFYLKSSAKISFILAPLVQLQACLSVTLLYYSVQSVVFRFRSCNKAVANVFPHKAEPSCATRTGQYLLGL